MCIRDRIQIFAFDFVHHGIHLGKTHNAGNYVAADHKWRYAVSTVSYTHLDVYKRQVQGYRKGMKKAEDFRR